MRFVDDCVVVVDAKVPHLSLRGMPHGRVVLEVEPVMPNPTEPLSWEWRIDLNVYSENGRLIYSKSRTVRAAELVDGQSDVINRTQ